MSWLKQTAGLISVILLGGTLSACGGGAGGSGSGQTPGNSSGTGNPPVVSAPVWQAGVYAPESTYKDFCEVPRTQPDATTGEVFLDKAGTAMHEKLWLRSWSNNTYLWYRELPDPNPADYRVAEYFALLKTSGLVDSGAAKDQFHFSQNTAEYRKETAGGVRSGYGIYWQANANRPPRQFIVRYSEPNSPAAQAGIPRGARLLQVNGVDFINDNTQAGLDKINAGLFPAKAGESHELVFADTEGRQQSYTLRSADVSLVPVQNVQVLNHNGKKVGYLQFNTFIAPAQPLLVSAFQQFQREAVSELVVDLRYNGGGLLAMSAQLAHMVTSSAIHQNRTFEKPQFNDKHPQIDPVTKRQIYSLPFVDVEINYQTGYGTNTQLPALNLNRVVVLTSGSTCSASEAFINGLRGIDVEVVLVGGKTCGKPYGFYPQDNCSTTYFTIQFQGVNAKGFGDFADGFRPTASPRFAADVKGCPASDDFSKPLGNPNENMLKTALYYLANNSCPVDAVSAAAPVPVGDGLAVASPEPRWANEAVRIPLKNL